MQELLDTLDGWRAEGAGVGRAVVVRTFGSAPRPEGAVLLVTDDGRLAGSVSGGCVEGAAAEEIWATRKSGQERVIRYGISDEQAWDVGLACGGTIDVLISPRVPDVAVTAARETREGRGDGRAIVTPLPADAPPASFGAHPPGAGAEPAEVLVVHEDGELEGSLGDAAADAALVDAARDALAHGVSRTIEVSGRQLFIEAYPVRPRLVVVGAVEVSRTLVRLAKELGYETVVIDGRAAFATEARFPDVDRLLVGWPDELADEIGLGPADAVAVLTHDVKFDEPAIVEALASRLPVRRGGRLAQDPGGPPRPAARGRRDRGGGRPAAGPDRARPRRAAAVRDGARDHGRDRRGTAIRHGPPDARAGPRPRGGRRDRRGGVKVVAVVLAAGASTRFGSPKLLAPLDGRPLLQHALDAVADAGLADAVVVLGRGADDVEAAIAWRSERRVVNPRPEDGLSSSLRVGLASAMADAEADAVIVVLGDQPALRPDVVRAVVAAAETAPVPIVRPRYAADDAPNPVVLRRAAWPLAEGVDGDRGLGPLLAARPDLVLEVPVDGANPDVDTVADLVRLEGVS